MCAVCNTSPCHPRCPNAPEPAAVAECFFCHDEIREGEEYTDVDGTPVCKDCVTNISIENLLDVFDMTTEEVFEKLGGVVKVAEYN